MTEARVRFYADKSRKIGSGETQIIRILILNILLLAALRAGAEDWPTYMHDNARSGVSRDPIVLEELNLAWVYHSPAPPMRAWDDCAPWDAGSRSGSVPMRDFDTAFFVAVAGKNVYFGSSVTNCVHCLDISSGKQKWQDDFRTLPS